MIHRFQPVILAAASLLLATAAPAQQPAAAGVYRCGNAYSNSPCPGAQAVQADDPRSAAQRQQAQDVKRQEARLAKELAEERQARDKETAGQAAARIGPSEAQRARAEQLAARKKPPVKKKKPAKPGHAAA